MPSTNSRVCASAASSYGRPAFSAFCRCTIDITPASSRPPITALVWFGHVKTNLGS